jgi:hypothetical protein
MVNAPVTLSQAAIGRALGLSPAAMTKLKKKGMPVDSVEAAQAWRVERQNVAQRKPDPRPPAAQGNLPPWPGAMGHEDDHPGAGVLGEGFEAARIRHKIAEANLAELEEARIKGLLVEKDRVEAAFFEAARGMRDGMTNSSRRLAAEVATLSEPSACEEVIARELRHLLVSFTGQLVQRMALAPPSGLDA